jgi:DNA-binding transcriptional LysR family regulator
MDLDLRKLRYFVALADELNYRRAAERLHVAQPVLTRQIRALEHEVHAQLFLRDHTGTQLTAAGQQLLVDARLLLAGAQATRRRVAQAARATTTFTIGFMPGLTVTAAARALATAHPDVAVEVLRTDWTNQVTVLLDGRADIGYVRLPIDMTELSTAFLFTEPHVAVLPAAHPLTSRDTLSIHDLAGEYLLQNPDTIPEWNAVKQSGRQRRALQRPARSVEEKLEWVAAGRGFSILPQSVATYYQRPDIAWVLLTDVSPNEVRLAWVTARRSRLIDEVIDLAHSGGVQSALTEQ